MDLRKIYEFNPNVSEGILRGTNDHNIKLIESFFSLELIISDECVFVDDSILLSQAKEKRIKNIFTALETLILNNIELTINDVISIINNIDEDNVDSIANLYLKKEVLLTTYFGKVIYPKTLNQKIYLKALEDNDIVFGVGPAGTGKTYLAVMYALKCLKSFKVRRIILVRPIVEAGEKLGFLPGDMKEKIDPYLIPIYDALNEAIGKEQVEKLIDKGTIEVAPLAYMRGRTLDNAIVILDEAQNATLSQMKMFLTRLGFGSKMIITGDISQIDLPNKNTSGMIEALRILDNLEGIKIIKFLKEDVMRHPLVFKIIDRYEKESK